MIEYIVYLQKNGVYVEGVRCKNQDEVDIIIDTAEEYERYLLVVRDKVLNMPINLEYGEIPKNKTRYRKGR